MSPPSSSKSYAILGDNFSIFQNILDDQKAEISKISLESDAQANRMI